MTSNPIPSGPSSALSSASSSATAVLDPVRTDQLRTFLVTEAAATVATESTTESSTGSVSLFRPRRLVLVGAATAALVVAILAVTSLVTTPGPSSLGVSPAVAVEPDGLGWTNVRLLDRDATPDVIVAQLHDAGIAAEVKIVPATGDPEHGGPILESGAKGVVGLSVHSPALEGLFGADAIVILSVSGDSSGIGIIYGPTDRDEAPPAPEDYGSALEGAGVRFGADDSLAIRNDAGVTVEVLTVG